MSEYRKVESFMLYDANILFGEFEGALDTHDAWIVLGYDLASLAQAIGAETFPVGEGKGRRSLKDTEFPIRRQVHYFGEYWGEIAKVQAVYARIDGPQMLSFRAVVVPNDEPERPLTVEYTYHGRFAIIWASAE